MTFTRIYNRPEYKDRRRELRATMTAAERMIWERVRGSQLGCRFRRQHSIGDYIVDFYCPTARLVVEIDGSIHESESQQNHDTLRTLYLKSVGHHVLRFTNKEVQENVDRVIHIISSYCP